MKESFRVCWKRQKNGALLIRGIRTIIGILPPNAQGEPRRDNAAGPKAK